MSIILFFIHFLVFSLVFVDCTLVKTTTGPVRGKFNNVRNVQYLSYEGIPYAESPIGNLRFQDPIAIKPWTEVLDATVPTPVCHQEELLYKHSQMSEDCLYLNVYSPDIAPPKLKPVMVFLHGGFFMWGSGNREPMLGPEKIIANDAVAVTLNYRLGVFGFLCLRTPEAPGNAGLKDVLLALKWISANIKQFGGDPNNISLAGVEAGAVLSHYLMLTEKSRGLFHKAFLLTGTALGYRALQRNPEKVVTELASSLGLTYTNTYDLFEQLQYTDAHLLTQVQQSMIYGAPDVAFVINDQFVPCIEANSSTALITIDPLEAMKAGHFPNIPIFIGFKTQEGLESFPLIKNDNGKTYPDRIVYLNENFDACIPRDISYPPGSQMRQDLANAIKEFYLGNQNINMFNVQRFIDLMTDTAYGYSTDLTVELFKLKPNSKVYYHLLNTDTDIYWFKVFFNLTYPGGSTFDSLFFVQPITLPRVAKLDPIKQGVLKDVNSYMYNFMYYGDPSPPGVSNTSAQWSEAGSERSHVYITDTITMVPHPPFPERLAFWRGVYDQYHRYVKGNDICMKKRYIGPVPFYSHC